MGKYKDTDYAYASARIRAVENKLIDKSKLDRMIDSSNVQDAIKVLVEAGYGTSTSDIQDIYAYESLIEEEMNKVYSLLEEISPSVEVFNFMRLQNDYHNAKVFLKAEFLGIEPI